MKAMAMDPALLDEVAGPMNLLHRRDVGNAGGSLLYGDVGDRALFSMYVCPGFFSAEVRVAGGPHLDDRLEEDLSGPGVDRVIRALDGRPDPDDILTLVGPKLMLKFSASRVGDGLTRNRLCEFIQALVELAGGEGVPLIKWCERCRRRPGHLTLLPAMLYDLKRLCPDCTPRTQEADSLSLQPHLADRLLAHVGEQAGRLGLRAPDKVRLWTRWDAESAPSPGVLDLEISQLEEWSLSDLSILAAFQLSQEEARREATRELWNSDVEDLQTQIFGQNPELPDSSQGLLEFFQRASARMEDAQRQREQANRARDLAVLQRAVDVWGADTLARVRLQDAVLRRLDGLARGRTAKLSLPDSSWQEAWQDSRAELLKEWPDAPLPPVDVFQKGLREVEPFPLEWADPPTLEPAPETCDDLVSQTLEAAQIRLKAQPDDPATHFVLAALYTQLDRWEEALQVCRGLMQIQADHSSGLKLLVWLEQQLQAAQAREGPLPTGARWLEGENG